MARSKYERESVRVTNEYFEDFVKPRLTNRDRKILEFVNKNRIVTSNQIARLYWKGRKQAKDLCNRRLRILYDLHCIDKFYPPAGVGEGSNPAHIVLDYAGAKVLDVKLNKVRELPLTFRHHVLVAEYRMKAYRYGYGWGEREYKLGSVVADIYYSRSRIAVEIDRGTETLKTIRRKVKSYNRLDINRVVFVTSGAKSRIDYFCDRLKLPDAGCHIKDVNKLLREIKKRATF